MYNIIKTKNDEEKTEPELRSENAQLCEDLKRINRYMTRLVHRQITSKEIAV